MATAKRKVGRPEKLTKERITNLVNLVRETGRTLKALCAERHIVYISAVVACHRHGVSLRPRNKKVTEKLVA